MAKKGLVAVLGSFDTWPYMDYLSRVVARHGYVARISKYEYALDSGTNQVVRRAFSPGPGEGMIPFPRDTVIAQSHKAVIAYSVPAGHYNEVHWCADQMKPSLGIAFVRDVGLRSGGKRRCSELLVPQQPLHESHSACGGGIRDPDWTAWNCIDAEECPFKTQGIAKNQLEHFHKHNQFMQLFAIEQIQNSDALVCSFLDGTLTRPP